MFMSSYQSDVSLSACLETDYNEIIDIYYNNE